MRDTARTAVRLFLALTLAGVTVIGSTPNPARAGDVPIEQPVQLLQAAGETRTYVDQSGLEVWEVSDGWDLDLYLFRGGSPLNFAIDVDRNFGPVDGDGHPAPGNSLFGLTGRISLRAFDVDDDEPVVPEVDEVYINGFHIGTLSGADDQWSVNTFEFPLSHLRLPTAANPDGRNEFWVDIDTGGHSWAVRVDWAALRLTEDFVPLAFVHGFSSSGETWAEFRAYAAANSGLVPDDMVAPSHSSTNLESGSAEISGPIDDLILNSGSYHTNVIAHSYGGLVARLYAWDHPSRVDKLILIGVPNGGLEIADAVCLFKKSSGPTGPLYLFNLIIEQYGDCRGPENALYQLQTDYVRNVFNVQVPDRNGTEYSTITGLLPDEGRVYDLFPGADDGWVTLDSSEYLSRARVDHPGKHLSLAQLPLEHGALIQQPSDARPISVCELYGEQCAAGSSALRGAQVSQATDLAFAKFGGTQVPAGGSGSIDLQFEGASETSVVLISDHLDSITPTLPGATFESTILLGANILAATISAPADGQLQIANTGTDTASVIALVGLPVGRSLEVQAADSLVEPASPVGVTVLLTESGTGEVMTAEVLTPSGTLIPVVLTQTAPGSWTGTVTSTESGIHSVTAWVDGARPRYDSTLFTVSSGQAVLTGAFTERLDGAEDGLADDLVVSPEVTIAAAGRYRLSAELADGTGAIVASAGSVADLPQGTSSVDVKFTGRSIFDSGIDGPYRIVNVVLSRDGTGLVLEDRIDDLGPTLAYDHTSFDHFPIAFDLDGFSDEAVDLDADGIDDVLRVQGSVTVEVGGTYAVNARLLAPDRTEIVEFQTTTQLTAGANAFTLVFDGDAIAAAGKDGPYLVEDLSVYPTSDVDILGYLVSAHQTAAYTADQFRVTPPLAEITSSSARFYPPPPCDPCTQAIAEGTVILSATGTVSASSGTVSADYRLWGVPANGAPVLVADWASASATDGAFDSSSESIAVNDGRDNANYAAYDLDVRANAGGQSATATERVPIEHDTTAPTSSVAALPASTTSSPITITVTASDNWTGPGTFMTADLRYRYRKLTSNPWGAWTNWLPDSVPPFAFSFSFPNGKGYYEFYSIATDQSGNVEAPPAVADAKIQKK